MTFESAAYVARYITKKVTGELAEEHYEGRKPEYTTMSRRPGIGKGWLEKYMGDVFPGDFVVLRGKTLKPPKFYSGQLEIISPEQYAMVKARRRVDADAQSMNNTPERLAVREYLQEEKLKQLKRTFENDY